MLSSAANLLAALVTFVQDEPLRALLALVWAYLVIGGVFALLVRSMAPLDSDWMDIPAGNLALYWPRLIHLLVLNRRWEQERDDSSRP